MYSSQNFTTVSQNLSVIIIVFTFSLNIKCIKTFSIEKSNETINTSKNKIRFNLKFNINDIQFRNKKIVFQLTVCEPVEEKTGLVCAQDYAECCFEYYLAENQSK